MLDSRMSQAGGRILDSNDLERQRRIPIQYAKRVVGRRMTSGGTTYMPLRVNMAGVIPVIFASSVVILPPTLAVELNALPPGFLHAAEHGDDLLVALAMLLEKKEPR